MRIIFFFQGRFEILCLSGSYLVAENGGPRNRTGGISISVCSPDGHIIGGAIGGRLIAASPVQVQIRSSILSFTRNLLIFSLTFFHRWLHAVLYMAVLSQRSPSPKRKTKNMHQTNPLRPRLLQQLLLKVIILLIPDRACGPHPWEDRIPRKTSTSCVDETRVFVYMCCCK